MKRNQKTNERMKQKKRNEKEKLGFDSLPVMASKKKAMEDAKKNSNYLASRK